MARRFPSSYTPSLDLTTLHLRACARVRVRVCVHLRAHAPCSVNTSKDSSSEGSISEASTVSANSVAAISATPLHSHVTPLPDDQEVCAVCVFYPVPATTSIASQPLCRSFQSVFVVCSQGCCHVSIATFTGCYIYHARAKCCACAHHMLATCTCWCLSADDAHVLRAGGVRKVSRNVPVARRRWCMVSEPLRHMTLGVLGVLGQYGYDEIS